MSAHNIPFSGLKRLNNPKSAVMGLFPYGLKNEFETAVVNEPSVFEPLKFYCKSFAFCRYCYSVHRFSSDTFSYLIVQKSHPLLKKIIRTAMLQNQSDCV